MEDLVQWLREQIAADVSSVHKLARAAHPFPEHEDWDRPLRDILVEAGRAYGPYIALLDLCEAHTAILDLWRAGHNAFKAAEGTILAGAAKVRLGAYEKTVRTVGLAYRHRPGYREEWRP